MDTEDPEGRGKGLGTPCPALPLENTSGDIFPYKHCYSGENAHLHRLVKVVDFAVTFMQWIQ